MYKNCKFSLTDSMVSSSFIRSSFFWSSCLSLSNSCWHRFSSNFLNVVDSAGFSVSGTFNYICHQTSKCNTPYLCTHKDTVQSQAMKTTVLAVIRPTQKQYQNFSNTSSVLVLGNRKSQPSASERLCKDFIYHSHVEILSSQRNLTSILNFSTHCISQTLTKHIE